MSERPSTPALASSPTALLLGIYLVAHLATLLVSGKVELASAPTETLMKFGANYAPLVREGQLHRLVASMFLHIGLFHLALNSAALVSIGPTLEHEYGRMRFVAIYLTSGVVASAASVLWHLGDPVVSAGASGALCGAIAAGAVRAHKLGNHPARRMLVSWAIATLAFGVLVRADNAAHVGGLLCGATLGVLARPPRVRDETSSRPAAWVLGVALLGFVGAVLTRNASDTATELVNRGVDLARAGELEPAIVAYRRALALEPNDTTAHYDLGLALERQKQFDEAIVHLSRARELEPNDTHLRALVGAHVNHGVTLSERGDVQGAIAAYRRALELDPNDANAQRNLGLALTKAGDFGGAVGALRRAVELDASSDMKGTLASVLSSEGAELARRGEHAEAARRYREAQALDPGEWTIPFHLGLSLLELRDAEGAIQAFEAAQKLDDSEEVRTELSRAIEARRDARADAGDLSGALDDLGRATLLRLAPRPDGGRP
ncbi:MAG: rhomboid family intramembrane serine protease [Polyangiaceae bacterium]